MRSAPYGRQRLARNALAVTAVIGAGAALLVPASAVASRSVQGGGERPWVAYQSSLRGQSFGLDGIFLVRPDGSADHEIATALPGQHIHPDWSSNGQRLVFRADIGDYSQLFLINPVADPTGRRAQQLTNCAGECVQVDDPAISPDGTQIAYIVDTGIVTVDHIDVPASFDLVVGRLTTQGLTDIRTVVHSATVPSTHLVNELLEPRWSPDGRSLVYWTDQTDGRTASIVSTRIFTVDADGRERRQVTPAGMFAGEVDWSPDGHQLVFVTHPLIVFNFDEVVSNLFTSRPDGTGLRQHTWATTSADRATQPRWTPSGGIIYTRVTVTGRALWLRDSHGDHPTPIAPGPRQDVRTHGDIQPTRTPGDADR